MWVKLKEAAEGGHHVTGIVNPLNGPNVVGNDLILYKTILNDFMNKGIDRTDPTFDLPSLNVSIYKYTHEQSGDWGVLLLYHLYRVT